MANEAAVLIVALSGRALAASARRGGYVPLVADVFGDVDTLNVAHRHVRFAGGLASGIEERDLIDALQILSEGQEPIGVVYGTGFEDRPQLLQRMAERWRLLRQRRRCGCKTQNSKNLFFDLFRFWYSDSGDIAAGTGGQRRLAR